MSAEAARPVPMMSLKELYRLYTSLAAKPGTPVPLSAFNLGRVETEKIFSIFDEDYNISRFFHFSNGEGTAYVIRGESATHLLMDLAIRALF